MHQKRPIGPTSEGKRLLDMFWFRLDIAQHGHVDVMELQNQLRHHISSEWIIGIGLFNCDDT